MILLKPLLPNVVDESFSSHYTFLFIKNRKFKQSLQEIPTKQITAE